MIFLLTLTHARKRGNRPDQTAELIATKILVPIISRQIIKVDNHHHYQNDKQRTDDVFYLQSLTPTELHLHTGDVCAITIRIVIPLTCMNSVIKGFCCRQRHFNRGVKGSQDLRLYELVIRKKVKY